jgi:nitrogen fixation protein
MRIHSESLISHPQDVVYEAYRDRLPELAAYIPDVKEIVVESREEVGPGRVKLHNVWVADREVPVFARAIIKPEMLRWDDFADWRDDEHRVHWTLRLRVFTDQVTCAGTNTFVKVDDASTKVFLAGDLDIDLRNIPGVPRLLAGGLKPKIEKFIVELITPNLERINESLQQFLDDQG